MRSCVDPLGRLLQKSGALTDSDLADVLEHQRQALPFASLCYALGHLDEATLVRALSRQRGVPGVVLDGGVIALSVLAGVPCEHALRYRILPVYEDERRLFVAAEEPTPNGGFLRELEFVKGKTAVLHVALHVTLARTTRACYRALAAGHTHFVGLLAARIGGDVAGRMQVVSDVDSIAADEPAALAHQALVGEITKEIIDDDLLEIIEASDTETDTDTVEDDTSVRDLPGVTPPGSTGGTTPLSQVELEPRAQSQVIDLDEEPSDGLRRRRAGAGGVLIVDDDFATRHLLVKVLQPQGYVTSMAASGSEAVRLLKAEPPSLVVLDVMLPEIDGFQICRAIKQSRRYRAIPVILMSAVIDSGRVTEEVLRRYGADAYFEKPLDTDRLRRRIAELLRGQPPAAADADAAATDDGFEKSLELYREGDINSAMVSLRAGIEHDPLSAKHHFVLANLLQKKSLIYEAIDEYEATVDLKPDYFPALTRLAYLYYKQGFSAKAIETWRRSLPYCPDPALRQNIEVFMRKLIADMQSEA
jgi:DNA-binding response OmpR family regulator